MPDRDYSYLYIDGERRPGAQSARIAVENPADETQVGSVPVATPADLDAAVAAARGALDTGPWGRTTPGERAGFVRELGSRLENRREELATLVTTEAGMPISISRVTQVNRLPQFYADLAADYPWEERRKGFLGDGLVRAEPAGVVGLIVPWNSPMGILIQELAPALTAGCTLVIKPAPEASLNSYVLVEALEAIGFPAGVVNIVHGDVTIGDGLVRHPGIDLVSFTGSARTAKQIMAACSERLARVHFELGGKSACILLDDAPLERALTASFASACTNAGQGCTALSRVLAPRRVLDEVLDVLRENALSVGFGDPLAETTVVGPVITRAQRDRIEAAVAGAREDGARTVAGGRRPDFDRGYWVAPTVLADVTNDMAIAREETFGPVVSVITYETLEEAVHIANDSRYGLAGAVWTDDEELGLRVARQVKTGTIGINHALSDPGLPFGGFKESGIGRKWGYEGLSAYTELQSISLPPSP